MRLTFLKHRGTEITEQRREAKLCVLCVSVFLSSTQSRLILHLRQGKARQGKAKLLRCQVSVWHDRHFCGTMDFYLAQIAKSVF